MPVLEGRSEKPLEPEDVERLVAMLRRNDVRRALLLVTSTPLPIEQIRNLPEVAGLTREQTANLITAIERLPAAYSPIPDREGRMHWYVCTARIRTALGELDRHCTKDSQLYERIAGRFGARFLVQSNVDETVSTAHLDDVHVDVETVRELLLMRRQPRTVEERLAVNHYHLSEELEGLVDRPWDPETLFELYARLTTGIPASLSRAASGTDRSRQAEVMRGLCSFAESPHRPVCEHPAITATIIRAVTSYWDLFPAWNGMMSRVLFRFAALKMGYPVLGYLPVSRSELMLKHVRPEGSTILGPEPAVLDALGESNTTPWVDTQLTLMVHALQQLRARMERARIIDEAVQQRLRADETLNHRQRSLIGRALRIPDATFRIGYHRTTHGIGYATAHRDFADLVARGYLVESLEGRMKVFRAGSALEEHAGMLRDVGRVEDYEIPLPPELLTAQ